MPNSCLEESKIFIACGDWLVEKQKARDYRYKTGKSGARNRSAVAFCVFGVQKAEVSVYCTASDMSVSVV